MANYTKASKVICIKTYHHPTIVQQKMFIKGYKYRCQLHYIPNEAFSRGGWYFEVYKYEQHTTKNPEFKPKGFIHRYGIFLKLHELSEYFLPYDESAHKLLDDPGTLERINEIEEIIDMKIT